MHDLMMDDDSWEQKEESASFNRLAPPALSTGPGGPILLSKEDIESAMREVREDGTAYPNAVSLTEALIREFDDVFAPPYKLPPKRTYDHVIDTGGQVPPSSRRVPRFSLAELEIVREWP